MGKYPEILYSENMIKFILLFFPLVAFGFNDTPSCLRDLQVRFFPSEVVKQSLDLFYVFQSQWDPILTEISRGSQNAPQLLKERAGKLRPNPLEHPFDPEKTKELLLAIEYDIFRNAMIKNYFYNMQAIQGMFDYIVNAQAGRIEACLGKKKAVPRARKY